MFDLCRKRWFAIMFLGVMLGATAAHAQPLRAGDRAPPFSVMSTTGKEIALADYLGKKTVVLFFYIAAFTST